MPETAATALGTVERIGELERRYVEEVLATGFRTSAGHGMTTRLEECAAALFERRFCIALVNGTVTLHAALGAAGVSPGDEVIVPPLTMSSTAFSVLHAGAVPVFADVDPDTWTLDPESVRARISPRTCALIPVALFGLSPAYDELMAIAAEHNLFLLEDAAQCFGGTYKGRPVGSIGHAASFSLQSSKHLTSGEGGLILTDDEDLADRIRRFSGLGYASLGAKAGRITRETIQDPDYLRHAEVGFNFRIPDLCAAVALAQAERMEELVAVRVRAAAALGAAVAGTEWLTPQTTPADYTNTYWAYAIRLDHPDLTWHAFRDTFVRNGGDGIYASWRLSYQEPAFAEFGRDTSCPVAERTQPRLLLFKTNYWDSAELVRQAEILSETVESFG